MQKPISVLVVDDDQTMAELACEILHTENFKTTCVKNGAEALQILEKDESLFDLVLTDLDMPFINGLQLIELVKELYPHLKIILMTGGSHKGVQLPEDLDFLEKPFDLEQLLSRINRELRTENTGEKKDETY